MASGTQNIPLYTPQTITGSDMNTIYNSAPYENMTLIDCRGTGNVPDGVTNHWFGFQWKNSSGMYGFQVAFSFNNDKIYKRHAQNASTLSAWVAV